MQQDYWTEVNANFEGEFRVGLVEKWFANIKVFSETKYQANTSYVFFNNCSDLASTRWKFKLPVMWKRREVLRILREFFASGQLSLLPLVQ